MSTIKLEWITVRHHLTVVHRESTLNNINANNNELNFQRTSYSPLKEEKLELKYTPLNDHSSLLTPINQKKNIVVTKSSLNENDEQNNSPGIIKTHRRDRRKIGMYAIMSVANLFNTKAI